MPGRVRSLQIITLANVAVAILVILVLYGTTLALAVIAPEISTWQLLTLLAIGVPMSVIGLRLTTNLGSHNWRRRGLIINGSAIALYAAIVIGIGALLIGTTKRHFIIPEGYKGDVYIVYSAVDGKPATTHEADITFRIPTDGVLYTAAPTIGGWTRDEYYYERGDGTQRRIGNLWNTTVQRTPENMTNDKDIGIFFPRSGTIADSTGCAVKYEEFYVGTKAYLLSGYAERNTSQFLIARCAAKSR
jgi:hypothetical protein